MQLPEAMKQKLWIGVCYAGHRSGSHHQRENFPQQLRDPAQVL